MTEVDDAVGAIRDGKLAIVPTDTVYGLATTPYAEAAVRGLYLAKGRAEQQPTALVVRDLDLLLECLPELRGVQERVGAGAPAGALHVDPAEPCPALPLARRLAPGDDRRPHPGTGGTGA